MRDPRAPAVQAELYADMTQIARFSAHILHRPLRAYQYIVAAAIVDSVLLHKGLTFGVMMSRQAGKNETSAHIEAFLLNLFRRRGGNIVKVSPTFKPQTINSLLRLQGLLDSSDLPAVQSRHGYMVAVGRAQCSFYSGAPGSNVVGATADILLEADEAQDLDELKWNKEFRPMGASTNVTCVLWGTAWTSNTLLARTIRSLGAQEAADGQRRVFTVPWPQVAEEVPAYGAYVRREIARLGGDHPLISTQYALTEIDAQAGMFPPATRALMQGGHPRARRPEASALTSPDAVAAGTILTIDVGGEAEEQTEGYILRATQPRRDSTALTVFAASYQALGACLRPLPTFAVQDRYYWTGTRHHDLLPAILRIAQLWQPQQVIIDATGIGAGLASFLAAELGKRVTPFIFGSESKSRLGWDFLALCNTGRFQDHAPDGSPEYAQFWREVDAAEYEITSYASRRMRWGVADPRVHDDMLISAALIAATTELPAPAQQSSIIEAPDVLQQGVLG